MHTHRIETIESLLLVGLKIETSMASMDAPKLWAQFMPRKSEITNRLNENYYSVDVFPGLEYFQQFNPHTKFDKWAAVNVQDLGNIPLGMETLTIPSGKYAIYIYKGTGQDAGMFYNRIFTEWLVEDQLDLENRPHMAIMGSKYIANNPDSEEEIWIPVK
jgi:AraC family transcriptional regulator